MELIQTGKRYICRCSYDEREVAKAAGFRWDKDTKQWWTDDPDRASKLVRYASDDIRESLSAVAAQREAAIEESRATDWDGELPAPPGLDYLPFQRAGIHTALSRPGTLLGDEMGLGKTVEAIGVINADPTIQRVLIVAPATLKLNWMRELERWLVTPRVIAIAAGTKPTELPDAEILIINWDILAPWRTLIDTVRWDLLIADEAHFAKSEKAARTIALVGRRKSKQHPESPGIQATRRLLLTGTPILNRPVEAWPLISYLDPDTWPNFWSYAKRFCGAYQGAWGWDFGGSSHLDELQEKLRSTIMIRRLKADVLTELPPKRRQVIEIARNGYDALVATESAAWEEQEETLARLRAEAAEAKKRDKAEYETAVEKLTEAASASFQALSKMRHDLALAKVPSVVDHVNELLESADKIVLYAHHHDVIDALVAAFPGCVKLDGRDAMESRQASVDRFQTDPGCRVFIGGIQAAGVGITLTAASVAVFAELDWVPANISQAEDRLHRIGQHDSVLIQHLVVDGSLDARMAKTLVAKQRVLDKALDDEIDELPVLPLGYDDPKDTPMPDVPEGRYCVETDTQPAFYRVTRPSEGRWAGYIFLEQQLGPDFHAIRIPTMKASILAQIAVDPDEALLRYGRELGVCGRCGRALTNQESRERGIGPVCWARWHGDDDDER